MVITLEAVSVHPPTDVISLTVYVPGEVYICAPFIPTCVPDRSPKSQVPFMPVGVDVLVKLTVVYTHAFAGEVKAA